MSNRRKVDLHKLAGVMAGQMGITRQPLPPAVARPEPAFPRVTAERINELLDDAEPACSCPGDCEGGPECAQIRFRVMFSGTMRYRGRPQAHAQATDGTAAP